MYDNFMEKYVYQMFILGCQNLDTALKKGLGGAILFTKDINNEESLKALIKKIKANAIIPPFISVDQEGGRVERTENIRPRRVSARYAFQNGEKFLREQADEISAELAQWGFNLNFAPCIDVNTNSQNPIIGERAFSDKTEDVVKGMNIFIGASRKFGVIPCVKHYPGHGDADKDSHLTLPKIDLDFESMKNIHIKPFEEAVNNGVEMIMAAHLHCTCFDEKEIPSSLSKNAIGYLRQNLGYKGVIISDDMVMQGVRSYGALESVLMGIDAGLDMFIFRDSDEKTLSMIDELVKIVEKDDELKRRIMESNSRIKSLKQKYL